MSHIRHKRTLFQIQIRSTLHPSVTTSLTHARKAARAHIEETPQFKKTHVNKVTEPHARMPDTRVTNASTARAWIQEQSQTVQRAVRFPEA